MTHARIARHDADRVDAHDHEPLLAGCSPTVRHRSGGDHAPGPAPSTWTARRRQSPSAAAGAAVASLRIGDAERAGAAALLGRAFTSGHLDVCEYEQRIESLTGAGTHGDLAGLSADLPVADLLRTDPDRLARRQRAVRLGLVVHVAAAALAVVLCWTVWLVVALTVGAWYPWPVWPLLGASAGVASHALVVSAVHRATGSRPPADRARR